MYDEYFEAVDSTDLSEDFKDLIVSLLDYVPSERPSIAQIRAHAFMQEPNYNSEYTRSVMHS